MTDIKIIVVRIVLLISLSVHRIGGFPLRSHFIYATFPSHYSMVAILEDLSPV